MRKVSIAALVALPLAVAAAACSSGSGPDVGSEESFQTDAELAKRALQILGAQKIEGAAQQCNQCHDINQRSLRVWDETTKRAVANLNDEHKTAKERIDGLRLDTTTTRAPFSAQRLGFLAAGLHLDDLPESKLLADTFVEAYGATEGKAEYKKLVAEARMPRSSEHALAKADYGIVKTWIDKGMPKLDELLVESQRPTTCEISISAELKTHIAAMKTKGWAARNREQAIPMFACPQPNKPELCFTQKNDEGKEVFPDAASVAYAKTWPAAGTTVRVLHELPHPTSFWSRNSADGRFMASGGGEDGAFVIDLEAQLRSGGRERREIGVTASHDPSFMPDNSGLLVQGGGTHFCTQDLFTSAATTRVSFTEAQCSSVQNVALYQSAGRLLADNHLSDYLIVNNSFESDNGFGYDPVPTFGEDQKIVVKVMLATGTETGYSVDTARHLDAPWEGDTMISPTTQLLASRVSGQEGQLGYSIRKLTATMGPAGYIMEARPIGRVCLAGTKGNFSFDERFLATHHYLTRADFPSDEAFAPYKDKSTSDIYVVDLLTGETIRATNMAPGRLALFPHYRSDGWLYFHVRDATADKQYYAVSDVTLKR